jgi:hypothetical protein
MKASELRIGNLIKGVYYKHDDEDEETELETICKVVTLDVSGIGDYPIYVYSDEDIEHFSDFEPIPLTEEWLLKFGFEVSGGEISYNKNKLSIYYGDTILSGKNGRTYWNSWTILEESPKYVHQLQNLYFALTGEELKQQEQ